MDDLKADGCNALFSIVLSAFHSRKRKCAPCFTTEKKTLRGQMVCNSAQVQ